MNVLAIVPARSGSKGIPFKNWRPLSGLSPVERAVRCVLAAGLTPVISSDGPAIAGVAHISRPPELADDMTPMRDVVQHVLGQIPGPPDQQILLVQPTQPLRTPEHLTRALELLTRDVTSVVSVTELPATHNPMFALTMDGEQLVPWSDIFWSELPTRRQDVKPAYVRDGTVYAFWRDTLDIVNDLYGSKVRPLVIPAHESCALDTLDDWVAAEQRVQLQDAQKLLATMMR